MIVAMSSSYETINGNQGSDQLDSESKSSVNIAAEILEAQRIVTRRLQQRREEEKNQRHKIYESSNDNISTENQTLVNPTNSTSPTNTYNTRLEQDYSPLSYRKSTIVVSHSNNNSSDEDDATKIEESFDNSETEDITGSARLKSKTEMNHANTEDIEEINYYMRPNSTKPNKFNLNSSHSTPSSYRKIYPNITNSVPRTNTFLKLSKEETLINDDNRKEPSMSKFSSPHIGLSYQPNLKNHSPIHVNKPIPQNLFNNNDDYVIEEDLLIKENPFLYYIIYPIKVLVKFISLLLYGLYQLFTSKPFLFLLVFIIGYCTIDSRYVDSVLSEFKYLSGVRSFSSRNEYWKSLWDHVRSPFTAVPISNPSSTSPVVGNTETYNKLIGNLNKRLDLIQTQINVLTDKTNFLVKDSEELSRDFNEVKYNEMFLKFKNDIEQISQEINNLQENYKDQINTYFDKKISPNNEKLVQFEEEIGNMKKVLDNYKAEISKLSDAKSSNSDLQILKNEIKDMNEKIKELGKKASETSSKDSEKINENEQKLINLHQELSSLFDKFKDMQNQLEKGDGANLKQFESIHSLFNNANERLTEVEDRMNKLSLSIDENESKQNIINYIELQNRQNEDHEQLEEIKSKYDSLQSGVSRTEKNLSEISDVLKVLSQSQEKLSKEYDELLGTISEQVAEMTEKAYQQDAVGLPDYALESSGARVISKLTTDTYKLQPDGIVGKISNILGIAIKPGRPPTEAIQPSIHPGECWAMKGTQGVLTLKLAKNVIPTQITVEHLAKEISFSVSSAPRFIEVYAIQDIKAFSEDYIIGKRELFGQEKPFTTLLGKIEFDPSKKSLQTFDLPSHLDKPIQYLQFQFLENWGNSDYTCIYRIRVHGSNSS
jgi:SUN domain-containing protein 1/2